MAIGDEMLRYNLFHGTDSKYLQSILKVGFKSNPDPQDWLGHGVYFFTDGVTCPRKNAAEWAKNRYFPLGVKSISVMHTQMVVRKDRILDLTTLDGLKRYNAIRDIVIEENKKSLISRRDLKVKKRKDFRIDDQIVMNLVIGRLNVDVVVSNLYIKNGLQRALELESCLPNSTVVSVINSQVLDHSKTYEVSRYYMSEVA